MKQPTLTALLVSAASCLALTLPATAQIMTDANDQAPTPTQIQTLDRTQLVKSADLPDVATLQPFSPEANYMSLPGDLRYLTYEHTGVWMTRPEAVATIDSQIEAASR